MSQQPDTYNILEIQCMHSSDSARLFVDRHDYDQLRAENERLKAELKSIGGALDDPRANLTLTTAEIIWELKAELAEAKKDAELVDACHEFINSPISVESCERFNKTLEARKGKESDEQFSTPKNCRTVR